MKIQAILTFAVALLLLQGCTAVAVGGAGAAGYYVGKDERKFQTIVDDGAITTRINSALIGAKGVRTFDIDVDTYEGVVTLKGKVASEKIRDRVIRICKETVGVKKVISQLKIGN